MYMCVHTYVLISQIVRATEKTEAGKQHGSTEGWAGVVLNRVIRL